MANPRIAAGTINEYLRKREDNVMRKRKLLQALKSKGLITFNHGGKLIDFPVKFDRAPLEAFDTEDGTTTFARRNRNIRGQLPYRAYVATDMVTKFDRLQNKGPAKILDLFSKLTDELQDDAGDQFADELYINGTAAANARRLYGVNTVFRQPQTLVTTSVNHRRRITHDSGGTATYAGIDLSLGAYGGTWNPGSSAWPDGTGSPKYDFWSALMVNYSSTTSGVWGTTDGTFKSNGYQCLRYGLHKTARNGVMVDMVLLDNELYRALGDYLDGKQHINSYQGRADSLGAKLGWGDYVEIEGATVTWEYGIPAEGAGSGYGFALGGGAKGNNGACIELMSMQGQLFEVEDKDFDLAAFTDRYALTAYLQMKLNPRQMFKLQDGAQED